MIKVQAKNENVIKVLDMYKHGHTELAPKGVGNLTFTGGKITALGGGWWAVSGYRADNHDHDRVVKALQNLKKGWPRETFGDILNNRLPHPRSKK